MDGDQLCPSGAAVLSALLPALFGRGEVVALPCIPEPANWAKLASPCTPETQWVGWGSWQELAPGPSPRDQQSDSRQSGHQPTHCVCMSAPQKPLCTCPHLGAQLQPPSPRALGRGASYRIELALSRVGSCRLGEVIQTISRVLGNHLRFQLHEKLMSSGTGMLVASMSLVLVVCPGNTELSGVISSKGVPAVQPVQQCWGSSLCHKPRDRQ